MDGKYFNNRSDVIPVEPVDDVTKQVPGPKQLRFNRAQRQIKLLGYFLVR